MSSSFSLDSLHNETAEILAIVEFLRHFDESSLEELEHYLDKLDVLTLLFGEVDYQEFTRTHGIDLEQVKLRIETQIKELKSIKAQNKAQQQARFELSPEDPESAEKSTMSRRTKITMVVSSVALTVLLAINDPLHLGKSDDAKGKSQNPLSKAVSGLMRDLSAPIERQKGLSEEEKAEADAVILAKIESLYSAPDPAGIAEANQRAKDAIEVYEYLRGRQLGGHSSLEVFQKGVAPLVDLWEQGTPGADPESLWTAVSLNRLFAEGSINFEEKGKANARALRLFFQLEEADSVGHEGEKIRPENNRVLLAKMLYGEFLRRVDADVLTGEGSPSQESDPVMTLSETQEVDEVLTTYGLLSPEETPLERAQKLIEFAVDLNPSDYRTHLALAELRASCGDLGGAKEAGKASIEAAEKQYGVDHSDARRVAFVLGKMGVRLN